jgi:hypothetical protein
MVLNHQIGVRFPVPLPRFPLPGVLALRHIAAIKQRFVKGALAMVAAIAISGLTLQAHHSISGVYDSSRRVTLDGVVAQFQLVNPHPFLVIDVIDTARTQSWRLEMDNLWELAAIGITASTLRPGDRVRVSGSLARTQDQRLYLLRLDRPADGFWYEQVGQSPRIGTSGR